MDGVPDEEVRRLLSVARRRRFSRNEVVFHREDPADSLHLISKGRFAIRIMTPLGETVTIGLRGPEDSFGEMALVAEGTKRSATVEALEEAETFAVYVAEFQRLRQGAPDSQPGSDQLSRGGGSTAERAPARGPLRSGRAARAPPACGVERAVRRPRLVIPLTQEQLAEMAGTSRATVNRVLREEQARGTVELRRGRTLVLNAEEIVRRAR